MRFPARDLNQGFMALMGVVARQTTRPTRSLPPTSTAARSRKLSRGYKLVGDNSTYLAEKFIEGGAAPPAPSSTTELAADAQQRRQARES
jgi:hypothetical protein